MWRVAAVKRVSAALQRIFAMRDCRASLAKALLFRSRLACRSPVTTSISSGGDDHQAVDVKPPNRPGPDRTEDISPRRCGLVDPDPIRGSLGNADQSCDTHEGHLVFDTVREPLGSTGLPSEITCSCCDATHRAVLPAGRVCEDDG
jgi:hypothetical protein